MLLRELGLEAAPAAAVAREDDLAADADAALRERLIIVGHAVIDVDHRRGDVAVALVGDIGRKRVGGLRRVGSSATAGSCPPSVTCSGAMSSSVVEIGVG